MKYINEINKRKTFAIISHPDAGKTTLTEKFLLFGGAIQTAGAVKSNKIKKHATSDFMEIERQRGISVATSVMTFEYEGHLINLLDTPGHKDFAEAIWNIVGYAAAQVIPEDKPIIGEVQDLNLEDFAAILEQAISMKDSPEVTKLPWANILKIGLKLLISIFL